MNVLLEPTPEIDWFIINGGRVPLRIWRGATDGGIAIEAYVLSIVPVDHADDARLKEAIPEFMSRCFGGARISMQSTARKLE